MIFYKRVTNIEDLACDLDRCLTISKQLESSVRERFSRASSPLGVKTTAWIAKTSHIPSQEFDAIVADGDAFDKNISFHLPEPVTGGPVLDFLGPDIDTGFRISKHSFRGVVTCSAHLAYLLTQHVTSSAFDVDSLRVARYEELKGVWEGKPYPIIWYHDNWNEWGNEYSYDEPIKSGVLKTPEEQARTVLPKSTRSGSKALRAVLVECAYGSARTHGCQFRGYHKALMVRRGYNRAIAATARKLLRVDYGDKLLPCPWYIFAPRSIVEEIASCLDW
ncbi:MAG: hypothetical protein GKR94_29570 [Gammaproteobacteria bacterium]|nr:hypothetical protein [Gammaproteobacteria bacterium]